MATARPLRDLLGDLAGGAGDVDAAAVLAAHGHAGLPADLAAEAVVNFADTAPVAVAEHLAPFLRARSGIPAPGDGAGNEDTGDAGDWQALLATAPDLDEQDLDEPHLGEPDLYGQDLGEPDLDGQDLDGRDLDGRDLDGRDLDGRDLDGRDLGAPDSYAPDLDDPAAGDVPDAGDVGGRPDADAAAAPQGAVERVAGEPFALDFGAGDDGLPAQPWHTDPEDPSWTEGFGAAADDTGAGTGQRPGGSHGGDLDALGGTHDGDLDALGGTHDGDLDAPGGSPDGHLDSPDGGHLDRGAADPDAGHADPHPDDPDLDDLDL